jgi:putative intracellular protease/amidase
MKKRRCGVFIFDGFADHEISLSTAWLSMSGAWTIETFSSRGLPVGSMSGLKVIPHASLEEIEPGDHDLLLLPGGDKWEKGDNLEVFPLLRETVGKWPLAAICAGTLALADLGFLDDIPHTSNFPGYLGQFCPDYRGSGSYRHQPCVNAGGIITASGVAIVEMAHEILHHFGIFTGQRASDWKDLYLTGGREQRFFNTLREIYDTPL